MSQPCVRKRWEDGTRSRRVLRPQAESLETRALLAVSITHAAGVSFTVNEGKSSKAEVATFTAAKGAKPTNFTVSIAWGDGTTSVGAVAKSGKGFKVTGRHKYTNELSGLPVVTTITAAGGASVQVLSKATIDGALLQSIPITITAVEGSVLPNLVVAKFQVLNKKIKSASSFVATAQFFDATGEFSSVTAQVVSDPAIKNGYEVIVPSKVFNDTTFPQGQATTVEIQAVHPSPDEAVEISTNTIVTPPPFSLVSAPPIIQSVEDGTSPLISTALVFQDPAGLLNDPDHFVPGHGNGAGYKITIHWGDGKTDTLTNAGGAPSAVGNISTVATGSGDSENVTVSLFNHPYAQVGVYNVSFVVQALNNTPGKLTETMTFKTTATITSPSVTMYPLQAYEGETAVAGGFKFTGPLGPGVLASFNDPNPAADLGKYTATVNWGDNTASDTAATFALSPDGKNIEVLDTHVYQLAGPDTITLNIKDKATGKAVFTSTEKVTVLAQPFAYDTATLDIENDGSFSGTLLTFQIGPFTPASDLTAAITWGDSSTAAPTMGVVTPLEAGGGQFEVTGSHDFSLANADSGMMWYGSVVITDSDGGAVNTVPVIFEWDLT